MRQLMSSVLAKYFRVVRRLLNSLGYYRVSHGNMIELICQQLKYGYPQSALKWDTLESGRMALANLLTPDAVGIELGVAEGYFSDILLSSSKVNKLFSIDCWGDHHDSSEYVRTVARLSKYGTRSVVMRSLFDDALPLFPDDYFDFIYIDAYAHTGQQDGKILYKWYPKLKKGGLFAGHDYDAQEWPKTVQVVGQFAEVVGKNILLLPGVDTDNPEDKYPSWYFFK